VNRSVRGVALLMALTFAFFAGSVVQTQTRAYAVPVLPLVVAPALPLSVVSAAVGGGISTISAGGALASAGITAAAVTAGNWAVDTFFSWGEDAPEDFGDPDPTVAANGTWSPYASGTMTIYCPPGGWTAGLAYTLLDVTDVSPGIVQWAIQTPAQDCQVRVNVSFFNASTSVVVANFKGVLSEKSDASGVIRKNVATSGGESVDDLYVRFSPTTDDLGAYGAETTWNYGPVAGTSPDPGTTPLSVTPTTRCVDGGGIVQTFAGTILKTTRSTSDPQTLSFPACPAGTVVQDRAAPITRDSDGALQGDALTGETGTSTPWQPGVVPAIYPDCANRACVMTLVVTAPDGSSFTCTQAGQCVGYATVVQQYPGLGEGASTVARTGPDGNSYQCRFGAYAVAVAECQVIPGAGLATSTDTDVSNCVRSGISWNPVSWVEEPVKCVLTDAFEVSTATRARIDTTKGVAAGKPPFSVLTIFPDWLAPFGSLGATCPDWAVTVGGSTHGIVCESPFMQKIHDNRVLFGAVMTVVMLAPFVWRVWHAAIPAVKVSRA
jgi:hypothetical protein